MFQILAVLALAAVCTAQKSVDVGVGPAGVNVGVGGPHGVNVGVGGPHGVNVGVGGPFGIPGALPIEVAPEVGAVVGENLAGETIEYPVPVHDAIAPTIDLPKGAQEVVDVPQANIVLPGNSIENKDLLVDLPSPVVEAPGPIIREKDVLFRVPQPVFYVPRPIVQHKPMVYRVGHTLRTLTPRVSVKEYLFSVPSAQIKGKSGYSFH